MHSDLAYLGLLILSKRNSFRINLEGRWEGGVGVTEEHYILPKRTSLSPQRRNASRLYIWRYPKGIISVSLFTLFASFSCDTSALAFFLQTNSLIVLSAYKPPNMQPPPNANLGSQIRDYIGAAPTAQ